MNEVSVEFYGGPFDGRSETWPTTQPLETTVGIRPDHDPTTLAVYRLQSITMSMPRRLGYAYERTIADSAA
ncbi:hypothetical protein AB0L66_17860 [Streptomyces sp. NPDC052207]|uniref:hypothetical protein n=1 Tax=Streptomyces sp. NPDC052207 TaxID=3155418 RepID=UPI003412BDC8